jgi:pimeloyl-ACP methyl ester carboxylesterase
MGQAQSRLAVGNLIFDARVCGPEGGPVVVLLHGWPEFSSWWRDSLEALGAAGYRAVAFDQRGYSRGARPLDVAEYHPDRLVDDVLGIADAIGARSFHIVAHDWGGMVAWALATSHPQRLKSLTVLSTPHPVALQEARKADPNQDRRLDYVRFFRLRDGSPELALLADGAQRLHAAFDPRVPKDLVDEAALRLAEPGALSAALNWYRAVDDDLYVPAGEIRVPTLYIWGENDMALGEDAAMRTKDFVKAPYQFVRLAGHAHWLPNEGEPDLQPIILAHLRAYD